MNRYETTESTQQYCIECRTPHQHHNARHCIYDILISITSIKRTQSFIWNSVSASCVVLWMLFGLHNFHFAWVEVYRAKWFVYFEINKPKNWNYIKKTKRKVWRKSSEFYWSCNAFNVHTIERKFWDVRSFIYIYVCRQSNSPELIKRKLCAAKLHRMECYFPQFKA